MGNVLVKVIVKAEIEKGGVFCGTRAIGLTCMCRAMEAHV